MKSPAKNTPATEVSRRHGWLGHWAAFIVAGLLCLFLAMAVSASLEKSPTFDEVTHLVAGYNTWLHGDFRFDPANGDFVKRWAALPLLLTRPAFPPIEDPKWRQADTFAVGYRFFFHSGNKAESLLLQGRTMVALLGVLLGFLIWWSSRSLFGWAGGLVSLLLFVFCPHMLAHGAMVSTDLAAALALFASTWFIWRLLEEVTWGRLMLSASAFGGLLLSKMSAAAIVPIAVVLVVVRLAFGGPWVWRLGQERLLRGWRARTSALAVLVLFHAVCGWTAIWAGYDFKYLARSNPADQGQVFERGPRDARPVTGAPAAVLTFCRTWHLLPEGYLRGPEGLLSTSGNRPAFMGGEWKFGGFRSFFPYAFAIKTPIPLFLLLGLGLAGWWWARRRGEAPRADSEAFATPRLYDLTPLLALMIVFGAIAVSQNVNIGHRHILPLYPPCFVLAGASVLWFSGRTIRAKVAAGLVVVSLLWFSGESLRVRPHYLAYFNQLAGGPAQGYRHLVDSSLDWGADLPGLKRWLDEHNPGDHDSVYFSYFGTGDPDYYGIRSRRLQGFVNWREKELFTLGPGIYAISATMLEGVYTKPFGPWNKHYEQQYQTTLKNMTVLEATENDPEQRAALLEKYPASFWEQQREALDGLRFSRLCAYLRQRPPDDQIGYAILLWRLDEAAIKAALQGPPGELYDMPVTAARKPR